MHFQNRQNCQILRDLLNETPFPNWVECDCSGEQECQEIIITVVHPQLKRHAQLNLASLVSPHWFQPIWKSRKHCVSWWWWWQSWWRHQLKSFSALLALCAGNSQVIGEFPSQRPVTRMFSLICAWTNCWINHRDTGDLRRRRVHYDTTIMSHPSVLSYQQMLLVSTNLKPVMIFWSL